MTEKDKAIKEAVGEWVRLDQMTGTFSQPTLRLRWFERKESAFGPGGRFLQQAWQELNDDMKPTGKLVWHDIDVVIE